METQTIENWQVESGGQIYDARLEDIAEWIADGSLLRIDRVRKGNLRWIEAGKVPALTTFFNARDSATPAPPAITTSTTEVLGIPDGGDAQRAPMGFVNATPALPDPAASTATCAVHPDRQAAYACDTCCNSFCKTCPTSYGATVRICPFCGAMCTSLELMEQERSRTAGHTNSMAEGFGFNDFGRAIVYPFRFKASLFFGALLFTFFSIGQSAASFGGIFMLAAAIMSFMLANMLTFGVLANTVESFTQGKLDGNFMPTFDDFSVWDDVVHPFFLSVGVYISSFGPFIAVCLVAFFLVIGGTKSEMNPVQADAARSLDPQIPYAANSLKQGDQLKNMIANVDDEQKKRVEGMETGNVSSATDAGKPVDSEEERFQRLNEMIQQQRKAQLESAIGKTPETRAKEQQALIGRILAYGALFLLFAGITFVWGLLYFPAACAVAGYTRSFTATLNPAVGFDTIRRLGTSYVLILIMGLLLIIASGVVSGVIGAVFTAFDLPGVGNLPAKALGSMFGFYLSVVFSCVIGYALYKASDRLQLN